MPHYSIVYSDLHRDVEQFTQQQSYLTENDQNILMSTTRAVLLTLEIYLSYL